MIEDESPRIVILKRPNAKTRFFSHGIRVKPGKIDVIVMTSRRIDICSKELGLVRLVMFGSSMIEM